MKLERKRFVVSTAVVCGMLAAAAAQAQTAARTAPSAQTKTAAQAAPAEKGQAARPGQAGRAARPGRGPMAALDLTQAQKDQLKSIQEQHQKDAQAVRERLQAARKTLREAMQADVPDEAAVKAAAAAVGSVQAEQFALQARVKAQRAKVLTPEQQQKLKDARARVVERVRSRARQAMRRERLERRLEQRLEQRMERRDALRRWWNRR